MTRPKYQLMPPLSSEQYESLKASIAESGVLVAVEKDEDGETLDGHHRLQICQELGITDYRVTVRCGMTEAEKRRYVRAINCARRHFDTAQKRVLIAEQVKETPQETNRQIARWLGVDDKTVGSVRDELEKSAEIPHFSERFDPRTGNLSQPAVKPKTIDAQSEQQAEAALKCVEITGLPDNAPSNVTALEIIQEANKTLYSTSENRTAIPETWRDNRLDTMMTSNSFEWYTPVEIANRVRRVLKRIDLDPCTSDAANTVIQAAEIFTIESDGLKQNWRAQTLFMNPPYGDTIGQWVEKLHREFQAGNVSQALALVPSRTDTKWWQLLAEYPRVFLHGRLKFGGPNNVDNSATFPSAIIALGCDLDEVCAAFGDLGDVYQRVNSEVLK